MRNPFKTSDPSSPSSDNTWLKFVCDSHLEWLMDMIDRIRRGELLSDEDAEHYSVIQEQAETFMAQAEAGNWTEDERRVRMVNAWWEDNHATS